jgi:hypothetical protein
VAKRLAKVEDEKYMGSEPVLEAGCSDADLAKAFNWYNYVCDNSQAKDFVVEYLKRIKYNKEDIKKISRAKINNSTGWMARILTNGGSLPDGYGERMGAAIKLALASVETVVEEDVEEPAPVKVVISIQERIANKTSDLIGDLEQQIDIFITKGTNSFNIGNWLRDKDVKPQIAQKIADFYKPLYAELFDAYEGKDDELKEAYKHLKKIQLKNYMEFVRSIVAASEVRATVAKAARKPRKKKEKPAAVVVGKMKYLAEDKETNLKSIKPTELVGAQQIWVYNVKLRNLSVYNAMSHAGMTVKGTTITGYDEKTSVTKKLRKPEETIKTVLEGGKVTLRKAMDNIKSKPKAANGRINTDTILLKATK